LLKISRNHCDWIIVDVPPFFSTPESYTVSQLCDGTIMVLKSGETRYTALTGLVADLEQVGIRLLGVIMNFRQYPIPRWLLKYI
jgi:Mrp family chromosome partitioning ATPase